MVVWARFWNVTQAACKGMWLGVVWAVMAGSGWAATETKSLQPWDGTEASINVLSAGEYVISATEDQEYVLTSKGNEVEASLAVQVAEGKTATLRLRNVCLKANKAVIELSGKGALRIVLEKGVSTLRRFGNLNGSGIVVNKDASAELIFSGSAQLWVFAQGSSTVATPALTSPGTIRIEGGELHLSAVGACNFDGLGKAYAPPVIDAKRVVFTGGKTLGGFFVTATGFVGGNVKEWPSIVFGEVVFNGGTLVTTGETVLVSTKLNSVKYPSSPITSQSILSTMGASIYRYPEASFAAVQAVAMGGQVGEKAFLRAQTEGAVSAEALAKHIVSGTTGASPAAEAVSVDTARGVLAVDVTECPEPKFVFADEKMASAVELFGCIPTVTEGGVRVDYDFGIFGIAPVRVEGEPVFRVAVRAAVRLPQETAQSKTFKLVVTRTLDDSEKEVIFEGSAPFVRRSNADTLYETAPLLTSDTFSGACGTYRYRVTASKAE